MKEMDETLSVHITKVLVAQYEVPGNLIRLEADGGRGGGAAIATAHGQRDGQGAAERATVYRASSGFSTL
jgi:hypothetical protein